MKERPILFTGEMVRALLDGRKTQTRRVIKPQPFESEYETFHALDDQDWHYSSGFKWKGNYYQDDEILEVCPYGQPGDRLWVRETWRTGWPRTSTSVHYKADNDPDQEGMAFKPSIYMPRGASRITLEVTGVRVEQINAITGEDAAKEGVTIPPGVKDPHFDHAHEAFIQLWDSINKKKGFGWGINWWVWVIEFKRIAA